MSFEPRIAASDVWRDHSAYVSLTMEFRCNLRCTHCMIEGTMDWLAPQSDAVFDEILAENARERRWKGIILTGSEITLRSDLTALAGRARAAGFEHVRIQTHGMHLANANFCRRLVDAGIDEYFVSVTAADAETHDRIAGVPGSFEKIMRGLENLEAYDVTVITNTVVTRESYRELPALVRRLSHLKRLRQMEFWNFFPMAEADAKDLVVRYADLMPFLKQAITEARACGLAVEVKNVPECLLGADGDLLVNAQPLLLIDDRFWDEFSKNGFYRCVHRDVCASRKCLGVNAAYAAKYGWEADLLAPLQPHSNHQPQDRP
jgi:MoaA/NifB/PqqE/SkfB family radical SAM enzyme